ncbi:MAG: peptidylprolyl isomerase [Prevotella sp.]|nr:peptidylprolyl isomerase [Prevotella sp.]
MEENKNRQISLTYELFAIEEDGERHLVEKAPTDKPFMFISGFGITLKPFEENLVNLAEGAPFDFTITPDQAYGDYEDERVLELDRQMFYVDGKFDREHIFIDAIIPLQNEQGDRFMGRVLDIRDEVVVIDLNHPLAGKTLNFKGVVIENRDATELEVKDMIRMLTGEGCCGGCGDGDCESGGCCGGGCGM